MNKPLYFLICLFWLAYPQFSSVAQSLPPSAQLTGLRMVYQNVNRCAPAALTIQLSYFPQFTGRYNDLIRRLTPSAQDVSVRIEEMVAVAEEYGLHGVVRRGGTLDLLKRLVAAGYPVLIENVYYDGANGWRDWMSHNRVMMGYDDAKQEAYFYDSLLGDGGGQGYAIAYPELDERWKPFNRDYLVVYTPDQAAEVQALLGDDWHEPDNHARVLVQALADLDRQPQDVFALYNRGWAELQIGLFEQAASTFDQALALGLPWRFLWYDYSPFEAYLQVGRYQDVIELGADVFTYAPGVEEVHYYVGQAYEALGDAKRAQSRYELALSLNRYFSPAQSALEKLLAAKAGL